MKFKFLAALFFMVGSAFASAQLVTPWAEKVNANNVWQEYPRPIMERQAWQNLNGEWDYAILPKNAAQPSDFQGKILVPFAAESTLSGVKKMVGADNELWYRRTFTIPSNWKGKDVKLNFEAVDWRCDVWVNGVKMGVHEGGYVPFSFNVTDVLKSKGENEVVVRVFDPTDAGTQPRGKQVSNPSGIWYTPVTGIWQTVWLEPVAKNHINRLKITPDVDKNVLSVNVFSENGGVADVKVYDKGALVASGCAVAGTAMEINMPENVKLWSTETPNLYDLTVTLTEKGKVVDEVKSYAAMRKVSIKRDNAGVMRLQLNNKDIFQFGPLDQGWWPDGLYTAPSYEAMIYDVDKTKDFGFNMIRKHIKVEPALWYSYCDKVGILVWQDMPSGDDKNSHWQMRDYFNTNEKVRSEESENQYRKEWKEIMDHLHNYPSIVTWIPFNEAWGQFKTKEIAQWTKDYDPSRTVNPASGGNFFHGVGDILDVHNYPAPRIFLLSDSKANVIGEYGGIGYAIPDHLWQPDRNWGYIQFKSSDEVTNEYVKYVDILRDLAKISYTGAVYTQTTDVEVEVNGLITYDREVIKVDEAKVREANQKLIKEFSAK